MGVLRKNENKPQEMLEILTHLHQYIPTIHHFHDKVISTGADVVTDETALYPILMGGDQLTAARARSALRLKLNSYTPCKKLEGIVPVVEDWHTKVNLLKV